MRQANFLPKLLLIAASISLFSQAQGDDNYVLSSASKYSSPFNRINIQTDESHKVKMHYDGLKVRSTTDSDLTYYENYFSKTPIMFANYYADGIARPKDRIDSAFALWNGRWAKSPFTQEHYQGGFLVYFEDNTNPFAHLVDGFISSSYLCEIMDGAVEDFDDNQGLLGEFKSTIARLNSEHQQGYSQASLDFTGDNVGFFVKDKTRLQQLTLMQDTYMHQLSYLGYNWGIESLLGRVVAQASKPVTAVNFIQAYEAMGYYPFKMKEKVAFGEDKIDVEFVHLLKPVNPVQLTYRFSKLNENIGVDVHFMSYFSTMKTFDLQILQQGSNGETNILFSHSYDLLAATPFSVLIEMNKKYAGQLLWIKLIDTDGILEPFLLPLRINFTL